MASNGYYDGINSTAYGAQGALDGGGFLGGSQAGSQGSPGGSKTYSKDSLRPLTIKQIIEAQQLHPDSEFKVDGVEVTQITFVAQVLKVSKQVTNITFKVDDSTGIIEVKQWIDSTYDPESSPKIAQENDYIRVWGRIKDFQDTRHVGAHKIRLVSDFNEVSYHLLHATAIHLYFTRGPPPSDKVKTEGSLGMFVDQSRPSIGESTTGVGRKLAANTSATARKVFNFISSGSQNNEGLHVALIARELNMNLNDVYKAGDELLGSGAIFTTADDETWAVL